MNLMAIQHFHRHQTSIRVVEVAHPRIEELAEENHWTYSATCNVLILEALQARGLITDDDVRQAFVPRG